jgi:hypothetical protein
VLIAPTATAGDTYALNMSRSTGAKSALSSKPHGRRYRYRHAVRGTDDGRHCLALRSAKGFSYAEAYRSYELQLAQAIARDGGKRTLNMSRARSSRRAGHLRARR